MKICTDLDHFNHQFPAPMQHLMSAEFSRFIFDKVIFILGRGCLDYNNSTLFPELTVKRSDQNHSNWMERSTEAVGFSCHFTL